MNARTVACLVASGRIAAGVGLTFAPRLVTRPWIGEVADTTGAKVLSAGFGARDFAIGAGTRECAALRRRTSANGCSPAC